MTTRLYPPCEIQASAETLQSLASEIAACHLGSTDRSPWLFTKNGAAYPVLIEGRSLEYRFEVFSLSVPDERELLDRDAQWSPPAFADDLPEVLRVQASKRPKAMVPPTLREAWPLPASRLDVLRRLEYIVERVEVAGALGENPNLQDAVKPGHLPSDAAAACEVAAALLFSSPDGDRLLIGVDWMPYQMVVSRNPAEIDVYLQDCIAVPVGVPTAGASRGH